MKKQNDVAITQLNFQDAFADQFQQWTNDEQYLARLSLALQDNPKLTEKMLQLVNAAYYETEQNKAQQHLVHILRNNISYFTGLAQGPLTNMTQALQLDAPEIVDAYTLSDALKDSVRHDANYHTGFALLFAFATLATLMLSAAMFALAYGMVSVPFSVGMVYMEAISQTQLLAAGAVSAVVAVSTLVGMGLFAYRAHSTKALLSNQDCFNQYQKV